jgi:hypothetical protein
MHEVLALVPLVVVAKTELLVVPVPVEVTLPVAELPEV